LLYEMVGVKDVGGTLKGVLHVERKTRRKEAKREFKKDLQLKKHGRKKLLHIRSGGEGEGEVWILEKKKIDSGREIQRTTNLLSRRKGKGTLF